MNREDFLKRGFMGIAAAGVASLLTENAKAASPAIPEEIVGFEHLPVKNEITMNTVLHKAETRGHANHGWLDTHHTFSFANYYNPQRMNFGALRVLNDDRVSEGMGFGTHPHENMEIISIPLSGDLEHKDSMGNVQVIRQGDFQIMSAGTGITHSEYNRNRDRLVAFLQIWVMPKDRNITPRYDQKTHPVEERKNKMQVIVSPVKGEAMWINQDAWFSIGHLEKGFTSDYRVKKAGNGVYFFVIEGTVAIDGQVLSKRDGFGIWNQEKVNISVSENAELLAIDVPMVF